MKMNGRKPYFILLPLVVLVLTGCDHSELMETAPGSYKGSVNFKGPNATPAAPVRAVAWPKSNDKHNDTLLLRATADKTGTVWDFAVKAVDKEHIWLYSPKGAFAAYYLSKSPDDCFVSGSTKNQVDVVLCYYSKRELSIRFVSRSDGGGFSLEIQRYDPKVQPPLEAPATYTVGELISRTFDLGFSSRQQFKKVIEARETTKMTYGNLLPHLSMASISAFVGLGLTQNLASSASNFLRSIGDLVPFLVPTRWFEASKADSRELAERYSLFLVKVDSANITQGLAYSVLREGSVLALLEKSIAAIEHERDLVKSREGAPHLEQVSTSDHIQSIVDRLKLVYKRVEKARKVELIALAQAAGFVNEYAISDVDPNIEPSIDHPQSLDGGSAPGLAVSNSYELRQLDALLDAARSNKEERYFNWLDPSGDPMGGLGFGTGAYIAVAQAQVEELEANRLDREGEVRKKASTAFERIEQSRDLYDLAEEGIETQNRLVEKYHRDMRLSIEFSMTDFAGALLARVQNEIERTNAEYEYYIAVGDFDRWLYTGPYANLSPAWSNLTAKF